MGIIVHKSTLLQMIILLHRVGSGRGLMVRVLDSRVVGSIPTPGMVRFWSLDNFIYVNLPQYIQLQMSINIVGKVPAMD